MKGFLFYILSSALLASCRIRFDQADSIKDIQNAVICFWHGKMLIGWKAANKLTKGVKAVVSPSKDGQILTDYLKHLGIQTLRGSSDKSPKELLAGIVNDLENGQNVAITPDGPRGPLRESKPGAVVAALRAGSSLIAMEIDISNSKKLGSWDEFEIPMPFSKITVKVKRVNLTDTDINDRDAVDNKIDELTKALGR